MRPIILYSGGLDSFVLAADIILNPFRYNIDGKFGCPALLHFTARDDGHRYTTDLFLNHQLPWLADRCPGKIDYAIRTIEDSLIVHPAKKPRPKIVYLDDHKVRKQGHIVGRGVLFTTAAFNYAAEFDSDLVYAAFQMDADRWAQYEDDPDGDASEDTPAFCALVNELARKGGAIPTQRIIAPFLDARLSKLDIIRLGLSLAVPLNLTHSCCHTGPKSCGKCNACKYYIRAVKQLGYDPKVNK